MTGGAKNGSWGAKMVRSRHPHNLLQLLIRHSKDPWRSMRETVSTPVQAARLPAWTIRRLQDTTGSRVWCLLLFFALAAALIAGPVLAGSDGGAPLQENSPLPGEVKVGAYVMDCKNFNVAEGTVLVSFYLALRSETNVSIGDLEIINGHTTSVDTLTDTPHEKYYRILATIDTDPDLRRYPFDRHVIPLKIEPKTRDTHSLVLVIDGNKTGLDAEADLPGWQFTVTSSSAENHSYEEDAIPYSRAIFSYGIQRDTASTILKFFLPILLIVIVSLSSLLMKVSSRLGLNASMFLAAVLIHWRVADAIPLVAYATFLDFFMIITYATLVLVLISGILILKFTEMKESAQVDRIYRWSIRIIPPLSITLYTLLFIAFMR